VANPTRRPDPGRQFSPHWWISPPTLRYPDVWPVVPTIDMRIDYHRMAKPGISLRGHVVKLARSFSVCEAEVHDEGLVS